MFRVTTTQFGALLLRDKGILPGFCLPAVNQGDSVDITDAVRSKGITSRMKASEWVAEVAGQHGFNGINAAYQLAVEDVATRLDPSRQKPQERNGRIVPL